MSLLTGVRDRLAAELGREPGTWGVVERVLEVVETHITAGLADGVEVLSRAAVARGLPLDASAEDLLAHERATSRMMAVRELFEEMRGWSADLEEARRRLAAVEHVLARLRSRPLEERAPAERELVRWLLAELGGVSDGSLPSLEAALATERERVAILAAVRTGLTGSAAVRWLADLNGVIADDLAGEGAGQRGER